MTQSNSLNISLFLKKPEQTIILYEVEHLCQKRLKLYSILQETNQHPSFSPEDTRHVLHKMYEENLMDFLFLLNRDIGGFHISRPQSLQKYYELDEMSHFLFALACSKSKDLKEKFLVLEIKWFQLRFDLNISQDKITHFLKQYNIVIPQATKKEILDIQNNLAYVYKDSDSSLLEIYKVAIDMAPNLLATGEVLVKDGFLYFPNNHKEISLYIQNILRKKWSDNLNLLSTYWRNPSKDERLVDIVENITPSLKRLFYARRDETALLTIENIDEHSGQLFPLCMSQLHKFLEKNNHLKHNARKQYAVFLKNAGLPYEDAIQMFKNKMTEIMSEEDFIKQRYFYYFSHCYGIVGGQIDYPAQTCVEIINSTPGGSEEHGCPFAHYSDENLRSVLVDSDIEKQYIQNMLDLKKEKKYKSACAAYFCNKFKSISLDVVSSPNAYYCLASENCGSMDIEDIFHSED